ncbi:MAG: uroporphyrinogen decarboxylase family protein [Planctomycetota bacterium]|jgi:uroporphyrinogen decarboxylase
MNARERFLEIMNFNTGVPSLKWEFGYWGGTVHRWYEQGLPKKHYPKLPPEITTPTSTLYLPCWRSFDKEIIPEGIAVTAGGLYWPTQGFPLDHDVRAYLNMDPTQVMVDVNLLFDPMFEVEVLLEDNEALIYIDVDGVKRMFLKKEGVLPSGLDWPIKDRASWDELKAERLNCKDISGRFPKNWDQLLTEYKNRDYPLAIGGYPQGLFGTPAHLMGYENLFYCYYDEPELIHDILNTFTEVWIAVYAEVLDQVEVDMIHFWEDISFGKGSMVSLETVRKFMLPYYKRIIDFLKARGIKVILLDTDGDCNALIPLYIEAGVTGMYPFEVHCGMDVVKVREQYPKLQMCGGISKSEITKGRETIDRMLEPVEEVLKTGGYIPYGDHLIPPDVPWEHFMYYRKRLNDIINKVAKG